MGLISRVSSRTYRSPKPPKNLLTKMGRRRSKRKPPPKKKLIQDLPTSFTCPFCNSEKSCISYLDQARKIGQIKCNVCSEDFKTSINYLTEPIDIYSEWIDACEVANDDTIPTENHRDYEADGDAVQYNNTTEAGMNINSDNSDSDDEINMRGHANQYK